ncbi:MAG: PAS domain S-box protein, partial [Armatimonadota bacterium]|nr:PAS domain S-box protein [Armatimonadota bacterium]
MATPLTVSRMPSRLSPLAAYLLSPVAVFLATWALFGLQQTLMRAEGGAYVRPFGIGFLVIVAVMTMLGGLGPGLWTLALSTLAMAFFLLPPTFSPAIRLPGDRVELALLLLAGMVVVIGMEAMRRNRGLLESAQKAEAQQRFLAETIPQLVWTAAPDGAVDYFNRHWHEYTGTTPEQPEGAGDLMHPDDQARMAAHWAESLKTGEPYEIEYRLRRAFDGAYRWFIARALPLRDSTGQIVRWFGTCTDIHDQKMFAAALEAGETRKAAILESALDCIVTMDHGGNVLEWNPAAEKTFGHRREDAVGKPVADLIVPPSLRQAHRDGLAHYLATGEGPVLGRRIEVPALRADGAEFPAELAISSAQIDGRPLFTAYLRDISAQKASEQEVQRLLGEAQARAEREALINQINETIRASLDPNAIPGSAARALGGVLGADRCYFATYDVPRDFCRVEQDWRHPSLPSLAGEYRLSEFDLDVEGVYRNGAVVTEDVEAASLSPEMVSLLKGLRLRAGIAVPLFHEGRLVSVLSVAMADEPRRWTAEEVALVETVAAQTRSAVEAATVRQREHHIAEALQDA